jgi:hypothetical protein
MFKVGILVQIVILISSQQTLLEINKKYCKDGESLVIPETQRSIFNSLRAKVTLIDSYNQFLLYFKNKTKTGDYEAFLTAAMTPYVIFAILGYPILY